MPAPETPTELFKQVQSLFETTSLGADKWYILLTACLSASPDPELAADLYSYIITLPDYQTTAQRQVLIRRIRESLFKSAILVGVPKPIEAILAIAAVEQPADRDYNTTRETWQTGTENRQRATEWFKRIYTRNAADTVGLFDAHKDFAWMSLEVTYGLFLSDRQVLGDVESELVTLPAIMMQNLPNETHWHIRGTRRIGVAKGDVQMIWDAVTLVAGYFGIKLTKVPTVDEVEPGVL
ncbi:hypothetical protein VHEMI01367 [[Torrubiella] hemipterigena]|uniref:Carboxymuconolactone decarboxylase-like domain-containing protein n=1 Tax=[Torrubiella] hemipterigena TaxID=1531966 RepID=A0A0A1T586_9HYPO|nr:hypothetical protein VHEMI01367 [[Torrubiella] hemipterigena]